VKLVIPGGEISNSLNNTGVNVNSFSLIVEGDRTRLGISITVPYYQILRSIIRISNNIPYDDIRDDSNKYDNNKMALTDIISLE
jgi:hypothetical protein